MATIIRRFEAKRTSAIVSSTYVTFLTFTIIITVTLILSTRVAISTIAKIPYNAIKNSSLNWIWNSDSVLNENACTYNKLFQDNFLHDTSQAPSPPLITDVGKKHLCHNMHIQLPLLLHYQVQSSTYNFCYPTKSHKNPFWNKVYH